MADNKDRQTEELGERAFYSGLASQLDEYDCNTGALPLRPLLLGEERGAYRPYSLRLQGRL